MEQNNAHIFIVEDTPSLLTIYENTLQNQGYEVSSFGRGRDLLDHIEAADDADLLVLDLKLPDIDGMAVLQELRKKGLSLPTIVITGHGSINTAVEAMRYGASDFLVKPFSVERLREAVKNELNKDRSHTMPPELAGLTGDHAEQIIADNKEERESRDFGGFIGTSPIMQKVYEQIESAAKSNAPIFITGESGTGKEVCAEAIHKHSARGHKDFVPINCAAIPRELMESELFGHVKGAFTGAISDREGAVKLADGGTLFLDEIGEMSPDMQTKLLRFLQDFQFRKVGGSKLEQADIRIICATNRNPLEEVDAGNFREDLFYRLHVLPLYMPPLRDRGDDILDIAQTLLRRYAGEENRLFEDFSNEAENILRHYSWPGNIRQLQNVIRNIVVMHNSRLVTAGMLPPTLLHQGRRRDKDMRENTGAGDTGTFWTSAQDIQPLATLERRIIEQAIQLCNGNIPQAAAALEISPSTIYRKKASWDDRAQKQRADSAEDILDPYEQISHSG